MRYRVYLYIYIIRSAFYVFFSEIGGGGAENSVFLLHGLFYVFYSGE